MSVGLRGSIALAPSGSWPNSMYFIPFISEGLVPTKDALVTSNIRSRLDEGDIYAGQPSISGDISLEPTPITAKRILEFWAGQTSSYITADSAYTHEILPIQDVNEYEKSLPTLSLLITPERDAGQDSSLFLENAVINGFTMDFTGNSLVAMTANVMAYNYTYVSSIYTPSYDIDTEYSWAQSSASYNGTLLPAQSLTITGENNMEVRRVIGSDIAAASDETRFIYRTAPRTVSVNGTYIEYTGNIKNSFAGQYSDFTGAPFTFNIKGPEVSSGYNGTLLFEAPNMKTVEYGRPIAGPGVVENNFTSKCSYDAGSGTAIQFTITNTAAW